MVARAYYRRSFATASPTSTLKPHSQPIATSGNISQQIATNRNTTCLQSLKEPVDKRKRRNRSIPSEWTGNMILALSRLQFDCFKISTTSMETAVSSKSTYTFMTMAQMPHGNITRLIWNARLRYHHIKGKFRQRFGCDPIFFARSPGRVNLIGMGML